MSSVSIKEYFALAGSQFSNADARIIGPVLSELQQQGKTDPGDLIEVARSSNCPLHSFFEWDDAKAGGLYREGQAREMLRSVRVRYTADRREYATRAHRIEIRPQHRPPPPPIAAPMRASGRDDLGVLAADMIRDLDAWRIKYSVQLAAFGKLSDALQQVLNQIEELREDFENGNIAGPFRRAVSQFLDWHREWAEHAGAAMLYGKHATYMQEAIADARENFERLNFIERRDGTNPRLLEDRDESEHPAPLP
jgi:hypothetical protein